MSTPKKPTQPGHQRAPLLTREQILDADLPAAMARLNRIARRQKEGVPQDQADLDALADSLAQIVSGIEPKHALGILGKQGQGRKPMTAGEIGAWFACVCRVEELRVPPGLLLEAALAQVAAERHVTKDSLVRWHKRLRKSAIGALDFARTQGVKKRADS